MNEKPISEAKDPDIRDSFAALKRAALNAREVARKTGTALVVNRNGKTVKIDPSDKPEPDSDAQGRD